MPVAKNLSLRICSHVLRRNALLLFGAMLASSPFATTAFAESLSGQIFNGLNGRPIAEAEVTVAGAAVKATTDIDGRFRLTLPTSTYDVTVRKDGFVAQTVSGVEVATGRGGDFAIALDPEDGLSAAEQGQMLAESITVTAEAVAATESALLAERRNAAQISDGMGSTGHRGLPSG